MGALHFDADIDISKFLAKSKQIDNTLTRLAQQASNSGSMLDRSFQNAGKSASLLGNDVGSLQRNLLGLASVATLGRLGQQVINIRGEFQQLGIAFEVMLGSKEKADKLMQEQVAFAQKTPFTLTDVATNTKQLLAMGIATEKVMTTMKALGDVAAGTSVPIARVAINYGQVATIGKLQGRELRDFAMAGIPLIDELAKNLGKAKSEISGMVEAGQIGFTDVEKAFQTMSGEGGKFYNLMERQNKSVTGQISNLTDKLQVMANKIGQSNEGLIYAGISGLSTMVDNYEEILKILEALIATYGIYRAALMLTTAAQNINTISTMATEWLAMGRALGFATANQMLFNSALLANPVVAAIAGITALVAVMLIFSDKAKTAEDHIKDLNDSMAKIDKQVEVEATIAKFEDLNKIEVKTTEQQKELNKNIEKLAIIFPEAISETDRYGKAVGLVTEKLEAQNKQLRDNMETLTESQVLESQKKLNDLIEQRARKLEEINTGKFTYSVGNTGQTTTAILTPTEIQARREQVDALSVTIDELGGKITDANEKLYDLSSVDASIALKPYEALFGQVTDFTKKQALDAKAKLVGLLGQDLGARAESQIINQINALDDYINKIKTTAEQEKKWHDNLAAARAKLKEINSGEYESLDPGKDRAEQEAIIKDLETKLGLNKKQKEAVDELKLANEQLEQAVRSGDQAGASAAAKKITLLENQKRQTEELMELELRRAWRDQFNGQSMAPVSSIGPKPIIQVGSKKTVMGILYEVTAIDKTGPVWKKQSLETGKIKKLADDGAKDSAKMQAELDEENFNKKKDFNERLLDYSHQFTSELISQLDLTKEQSEVVNGFADTIFNLAKGDYLAAGFSAASTLINAISSGAAPSSTTKALEHVNSLLEQQSAILANLSGNNYFELAAKQYDDLGESIELTTQKLKEHGLHTAQDKENYRTIPSYSQKEYNKYGQENVKDFDTQDFIDAYTKGVFDFNDAEAELVNSIITAQKQRAELIQSTFREALGFDSSDIADSIFQGIEDGLRLGENSLGGFAQSFGELMKQALMQSVIDAMELDIANTFLPKYKDAMADGILTDKERKDLESIYESLVKQGQIDSDNIKTITDPYLNPSGTDSQSPMKGISASYTEDTLSAMVGQTMAQRVDIKTISVDTKLNQELMRNQLELMDQGLNSLQAIERNTRGIARLENVENELKEMNRTLKANG